jgi:DNA primase
MNMFPVKTPEGKVKAVNFLMPHIQRVPSRIIREGLAGDIAQKLGIDSTVLRAELKTVATQRSKSGIKAIPDAQVTPSEKIVIRAASSTVPEEADLRRIALDALNSERLHTGLATESLLEALATAAGQSDTPANPLELPLEDSERQMLARIIMREDTTISVELLEGALEALRHRLSIVQRERDIKQGIADAERRNDMATSVRLQQELLELNRKLAAGN